MNHSRTLNNRIIGLHKTALSLVYNDFSSSFPHLLEKDKSVTVHHCNLQTIAFEIFKAKNNMVPKILLEIFPQKEINYSLRNSTTLQGRSIKTVRYASETLSSLGPKVWDILRTEKKWCLLHYSKRKFVNRPRQIAHVVYVKRTYKTLDFCSCTLIFFSVT